ncbi:hypothetical protein IAE19_03685 [Acinetobacter sp. S40]|uniref:hypothetical protein n=1 Tax=unclassified Acinetobacter TaxID=196816 RepID=UPI00190A1930|nr:MULTISPECIES: hypothetical protein [unclassified Acinetobacter]MBJ9984540.1 hypothetical protein [Acinetobacter sp. S40]MBK0062257.1 hypothetical protein [Acinetobacter sp. S55]MBK0066061.1 hypothetical protein [Acinetobacter sp. S54]
MKKQITASVLTASVILLTACASNPTATTAIQKENNQFEVTGVGKTNLIAKNNAVDAANKTCKRSSAVIVDEKTTYNGVLKGVVDEETGKIVEAAAGVIGSITGKNASLAKDDDYQTTLTFYCKAS